MGLELHPDKTKILHNQQQQRRPRQQPEHVKINDMKAEVLPHTSSQKYLGRRFSFHNSTQTEVENRIAAGWRKFFLLKRELTTKSYSVKGRLRLFNGTVTPTIFYGSAAWTLTTELENRIRRTQRQMLRMVLGSSRRRNYNHHNEVQPPKHDQPTTNQQPQPQTTNVLQPPAPHTMHQEDSTDNDSNPSDVNSEPPHPHIPNDDDTNLEPWVEFIRRCIHEAEALVQFLGIEDWISQQRRKKWRWARKIATVDRHK